MNASLTITEVHVWWCYTFKTWAITQYDANGHPTATAYEHTKVDALTTGRGQAEHFKAKLIQFTKDGKCLKNARQF